MNYNKKNWSIFAGPGYGMYIKNELNVIGKFREKSIETL